MLSLYHLTTHFQEKYILETQIVLLNSIYKSEVKKR